MGPRQRMDEVIRKALELAGDNPLLAAGYAWAAGVALTAAIGLPVEHLAGGLAEDYQKLATRPPKSILDLAARQVGALADGPAPPKPPEPDEDLGPKITDLMRVLDRTGSGLHEISLVLFRRSGTEEPAILVVGIGGPQASAIHDAMQDVHPRFGPTTVCDLSGTRKVLQ